MLDFTGISHVWWGIGVLQCSSFFILHIALSAVVESTKACVEISELHLFWTLKGYSIPNLVELFEAAIPHA